MSGGAEGHYTAGGGEIRRTPITDRAWPQATTTWVSSSSNSVARRRPKPVAPSGCPSSRNWQRSFRTINILARSSPMSWATWQTFCARRETTKKRSHSDRQAREIVDKLAADYPDVPGYQNHAGDMRFQLAGRLSQAGKREELARLLELAVAHKQSALKSTPNHPEYLWTLAFVQENLGLELYRMERLR